MVSYSSLVSACENWQVSSSVLQDMQLAKVPCDTTVQNSMISVWESGGWRQAQSFLCWSGLATIRADAISFNGLIRAAQHGYWAKAQLFLRLLPKQTLAADVISYNSAIQACGGVAEWQQASSLLQGFESRQLEADAMAFSTTMGVLAEAGQWPSALRQLDKLQQFRMESDVVACNMVLSASGLAEMEARRIFGELRARKVANIKTYNSMISLASQRGDWQQSLLLLADMADGTVQADGVTHSLIAEACAKALEWQQAVCSMGFVAKATQRDLFHLRLRLCKVASMAS